MASNFFTIRREYPHNHHRLLDSGDDLQLTAALRAVFEINVENAFKQVRPAHARRRLSHRVVFRVIATFASDEVTADNTIYKIKLGHHAIVVITDQRAIGHNRKGKSHWRIADRN